MEKQSKDLEPFWQPPDMSSKQKQISNGLIYIVRMGFNALLPLFVLPIFTRILTREDYGLWALAQVYAVFATGICNMGLLAAFDRNFFEDANEENRRALLCTTLLFISGVMIMIGLATYIFRSTLAGWIMHDGTRGSFLFLVFCSTALVSLNQYGLSWLKNTENARRYMFLSITEKIAAVSVSLLLVAGLRIGVTGLIVGQLVGAGLLAGLLASTLSLRLVFRWSLLFYSLRISLPLTPTFFLGVINTQFDKYMIGLMRTVGGVGVFSIGQMISKTVFLFMTTIQNVFSPQVYQRMFEMDAEEGGRSIGCYLTPFAYISVGVALLLSFFSEEALRLLTPPSYHASINIVMVLSIYYAFLFFGKQPQLIYAKKTHITSLLIVFGAAINVGLNIPMVYKFGAIGAAWATLLAGVISTMVTLAVSQRYYRINWEYRRLILMYAIFCAGTIALLILRSVESAYFLRFFIKLIGVTLYVFLGVRLNVLTSENLRLVFDSLLFRKNR